MYFKQFFNEQLAQYSYLVGCQKTGEAIVIDPLRDVTPYIEAAEKEGLRITHVTETHIHADFTSGIREVINMGAQGYVSGHGGKDWTYQDIEADIIHEGDVIKVGNVKLEVMHTPGILLKVLVSCSMIMAWMCRWDYLQETLSLSVMLDVLIY